MLSSPCPICGSACSVAASSCPDCGYSFATKAKQSENAIPPTATGEKRLCPCPDCGHNCSVAALSCPNCGRPFASTRAVDILTQQRAQSRETRSRDNAN